MKTFAQNIKEIRQQLNLTQEQFANKLGYSYQLIGCWENGRSFPNLNTAKRIHEVFGVDYEDIFDYDLD
ncbi:MAG: helix-turn-helix transcriptional regulator [Clostridia bacterium]|nr:helix-turn-helix transcriptional regulator [Clostridia bacterium]